MTCFNCPCWKFSLAVLTVPLFVVDMASSVSSGSTAMGWRRSSGKNSSKTSRKRRWETAIMVGSYFPNFFTVLEEQSLGVEGHGTWESAGHGRCCSVSGRSLGECWKSVVLRRVLFTKRFNLHTRAVMFH